MARLVLDTNSLLQILPKRSPYHDIWISLFDGRNTFCISNEILEEYEEILQRKVSVELASLVTRAIVGNPHTSFVTPFYQFNLISADPDDNKFVDCAVCGNAKVIVTEDKHFDILKSVDFPRVNILSIDKTLKYFC